jgi:DNA-binding Lrp family transcriptional regulator
MKPQTIRLLSALRENSREKLTSISRKTNIPISTLFDMLKELQHDIIEKNTVLLNFSQLGYHTLAQVYLEVENCDLDRLRKHLICHPKVNSVYKINNGWHFVIETVHKNIKQLDSFLQNIEDNFSLKNKKIHYLIDDIKREGFQLTA